MRYASTPRELDLLARKALPGDRIVYGTGLHADEFRNMADAAASLGSLFDPLQRRVGPDMFEYFVQRRHKPRPVDMLTRELEQVAA